MANVTLYIPEELEKGIRKAAETSGIPLSRWISERLAASLACEWPVGALDALGAFPDFPSVDEIRSHTGVDAPREQF